MTEVFEACEKKIFPVFRKFELSHVGLRFLFAKRRISVAHRKACFYCKASTVSFHGPQDGVTRFICCYGAINGIRHMILKPPAVWKYLEQDDILCCNNAQL